MGYESAAELIELGYLFDFKLPDAYPQEMRDDLTLPFQMAFEQGLEDGVIDRPVEIVFREVEGLPTDSVKAMIDAYGELVDEVPRRPRTIDHRQLRADSSTGSSRRRM